MADEANSTISWTLKVDTKTGQAELQQLQQAAESTAKAAKEAVQWSSRGEDGAGPLRVRAGIDKAINKNLGEAATAQAKGAKTKGIDERASAAAEAFNKAIGKATLGLLSFAGGLGDAVNLAFEFAKTPGEDNHKLEMAQDAVAAGMTKLASGDVIGAVIGAGMSLAASWIKLQKEIEAAQREFANSRWNEYKSLSDRIGAIGEEFAMKNAGGREERLGLMSDQLFQMAHGAGARSLDSLREKIAQMQEGGDTKSLDYQNAVADFNKRKAEYDELRLKRIQESINPFSGFMQKGDYGDAMSSKGLGLGGNVKIEDTNERIYGLMRKTYDALEAIRRASQDNVLKLDAVEKKMGLGASDDYLGIPI